MSFGEGDMGEDMLIIGYCSTCGAPVTRQEAFGIDFQGGWKKGKGYKIKECCFCGDKNEHTTND